MAIVGRAKYTRAGAKFRGDAPFASRLLDVSLMHVYSNHDVFTHLYQTTMKQSLCLDNDGFITETTAVPVSMIAVMTSSIGLEHLWRRRLVTDMSQIRNIDVMSSPSDVKIFRR